MSWSHGYVADVPYTASYHAYQAPSQLGLACLLNRVHAPLPARRDDLTYVEVGCGRGRTALCLAASNPGWRVIGIDLLPAHVAEAREIATEAGIGNVEFIEADLASFDASLLPEIDVASAHGFWSWVADPVRDGLVRILAARLRAGGLLHLSYNALPAWQEAIGLQRLLIEAGDRIGGRSDHRAAGALELVQALRSAGAAHLNTPYVSGLIDRARGLAPGYVSHEYMNRSWRPCFHADVLDALAPARLDHVGSAVLLENFPELVLTDAQRAICDRIDEPRLRELTRDICMQRALRDDVYVRGARRMSREAQEQALAELTVCLTRLPDEIVYALKTASGTATLTPEFFRPVVQALGEGPRRVGDLLSIAAAAGQGQGGVGRAIDLVGMLVGSGQAMVVTRPEASVDSAGSAAGRLNRAIAGRITADEPGPSGETGQCGLASTRLGAGLACAPDALVAAVQAAGPPGDAAPPVDARLPTWRHAGIPGIPPEADEVLQMRSIL
ncbi:class I SAM-dependent methyltransferase [Lichenicola sp.]|uniref:class I SAM-dependent methyltransferase n=1 Tax=Lichenicola sp. TaxID=2804529 RepID=UPI003B002E98